MRATSEETTKSRRLLRQQRSARREMGNFITCTAAALVLSVISTAHARPHESSGMQRIVVLGDSLSDGFRLSRAEAYPALLAQKLGAAGLSYEVVNASVSGDTSAGGLRRLPNYLQNKIDILVLELGVNDAFRGVAVDQIRTNLQTIIDKTRAKNPNVAIVVVGMNFVTDGSDDYVRAFGQMFSQLAAENHAALVFSLLAGVAGDPTLNLPDRVHPNAAGHRILAENVWRILEPVAREVASR